VSDLASVAVWYSDMLTVDTDLDKTLQRNQYA
jgi:hypothetical protein